MQEDFDIDSRVFLQKAQQLISNNSKQDLFYASLNLRFGIEYRIKQYAHAMKEYLEHKKKTKEKTVPDLYKSIENAFNLANKIIKLTVITNNNEIICELYHTPVTKKLHGMHGELGRYLHINESNKLYEPQNWNIFKNFLLEATQELNNVLIGKLLSPPIKAGQILKFSSELDEGTNLMQFYFDKGIFDLRIKVDYLDKI